MTASEYCIKTVKCKRPLFWRFTDNTILSDDAPLDFYQSTILNRAKVIMVETINGADYVSLDIPNIRTLI